MSFGGFDPEILQDFLTESGELLDQLEADLVTLESTPSDPALLNQVFRALHTIKGSASFLALTNLVKIAHASEGALNAARSGNAVVDRAAMDLLLQAVDTIKRQMAQLREGVDLEVPDESLVAQLMVIAEGKASASPKVSASPVNVAAPAPSPNVTLSIPTAPAIFTTPVTPTTPGTAVPTAAAIANSPAEPDTAGTSTNETPIKLSSEKADLLEFLVADVYETLDKMEPQILAVATNAARSEAASNLNELTEALLKSVDFFGLDAMTASARALANFGGKCAELDDVNAWQATARALAVGLVLRRQAEGLKRDVLLTFNTETLLRNLSAACDHLEPQTQLPEGITAEAVLELEGINEPVGAKTNDLDSQADAVTEAFLGAASAASALSVPAQTGESKPFASGAEQPKAAALVATKAEATKADAGKAEAGKTDATKPEAGKAAAVEQTIRVEVHRLESLMNLVGELVLQKNRVLALSRRLQGETAAQELKEHFSVSASGLDRVTSDIQIAVMRTRMQPLDKLFGKYPRLIRDLAHKTGKKIELVVEGGETEVDKSVIEELGDPLVHLMRNSADHGIEMPEDRVKAGKSELGTIRLQARHEGSHVRILVTDDGKGLDRDRIAKKAIERGMVKESDVANLSDREVFNFIFLPGFSTAEQVSDLSGRGVGMDVVRTNIEKIKGNIDLSSTKGKGSTISITIPLTVAIMQAMMVGVGKEVYAVPLDKILEIVKPPEDQVSTIGESPVMRLRDGVLPLISAADIFGCREENGSKPQTPFAVLLHDGDKRLGMMVSRLIGQQEIVIKPLETLQPTSLPSTVQNTASSAAQGTGKSGEQNGTAPGAISPPAQNAFAAPAQAGPGVAGKSHVKGPVSGATVRDDGGVSLIVDVAALFRMNEAQRARARPKAA